MPESLDPVTLAHRYVEASNAHDVERIREMVAGAISYSSSGMGEHSGREAVVDMLKDFYARFPDAHWACTDYRQLGADAAAFQYVLRGIETGTGQVVLRAGLERVWFDGEGRIRRIEVRDGEQL